MPAKKEASEKSVSFVGKKIPSFKLAASGDQVITSKEVCRTDSILYFYPKDSTSGCTREGEDFRDMFSQFKKLGVSIYGVSRDSVASHDKFKAKYDFPFDLLSDSDEVLCKALDVIKMKSLYGRKYLGVERSTFLVGKDGKIKKEWRNVKVPGHVQDVLDYVKSLK